MKRKVAHSEEERKAFIEKGFQEVGKEESGNYVFQKENCKFLNYKIKVI
jgi:L-amino acid N-acyltransferase YncA